jgi:hypothetical protein
MCIRDSVGSEMCIRDRYCAFVKVTVEFTIVFSSVGASSALPQL